MREIETLREQLMRPAVLFEPSEEPVTEPESSCFGAARLALPDEGWPEFEGRPMISLLQLNLDELAYRPPGSEDVRLLTFFVQPEGYPENDDGWVLRTYRQLSGLVELRVPSEVSPVRPVRLGPPVLVEDYPCFEDLEKEVEDELWDVFSASYTPHEGVKLGGWPSLIQSEIFWAPGGRHPAAPRYVLQIDSMKEANWQWGDRGCAYIGRGTRKGFQQTWTFDWQCL